MDLEEAKKKKLAELQESAETEAKIRNLVRSLLSEKARERLNNVALVNKGLYLKAVQLVLQLQQAGQLTGKLTEQQLKQLLERLGSKREIVIKRK